MHAVFLVKIIKNIEPRDPGIFPQNYKYIIAENSKENVFVLRAAMKSAEDAESWVRAFETTSLTRWINKRSSPSNPQLMVYHKYWMCHLSTMKKSPALKFSKKVGCNASLDIKIKKITRSTRSKDKFLRMDPPFNAVIKINLTHDHTSASNLLFLRPSADTERQFKKYFEDGLTPTQATKLHESKLLLTDGSCEKLANNALNPKYRWVRRQFIKWKNHRLEDEHNILEKK